MNKKYVGAFVEHVAKFLINKGGVKTSSRFESISIEIDKISVKNFGATIGQNMLKAFILKPFSGLIIGFESRTGHQQKARLEWRAFFAVG